MKTSIFGTRKDVQASEEFELLKNQLEQQLRDISAEKSDVIRESQVLKEQLRTCEKDLSEARERTQALEEMMQQNEEERRYQEATAEELARLQEIEAAAAAARRENSEMIHTIAELRNQLNVKNELIDGQKSALCRSSERIEELEKALAEQKTMSSALKGTDPDEPESAERIQTLEKKLRENEILLKHYEDAEKNNILLNQELAKAKNFIKTLKKSITQLMEQMESQQNGIQYFAENMAKQQNDMKEKLQEMTEVQLRNVELEDSLSNMTGLCETLKKKNEMLLHENEILKQSVRSGMTVQPSNIITPEKFEKKATDLPSENRTAMALSRCEDAYENAKNLLSGIMEDEDIPDDVFGLMS